MITRFLAVSSFTLLSSLAAQTVPTGFVVDTLVSSGLSQPTDIAFLPDGRVLVADKPGGLVVYAAGNSANVGTVPNVLAQGGETGLLSVEVDPSFATTGRIFVLYREVNNTMRVDRFELTGSLVDPSSTNLTMSMASQRVVLDAVPAMWPEHNGGTLRFGPDGLLYVTTGDDLAPCDTQDPTIGNGCLFRLRIDGLPPGGSTVAPAFDDIDPGDNPLSAATDLSQLVIGLGLRNPFTMEIDPLTGDVVIGDVGSDAREEISLFRRPSAGSPPMLNFGWPWREGDVAGTPCSGAPPANMTEPIVAVQHGAAAYSIMCGSVYRNQGGQWDFGNRYEGCLFYHDYWSGEIEVVTPWTGWSHIPQVPGQVSSTVWGSLGARTVRMRQGPDGALYYLQHPWTLPTSTLMRIRYVGPAATIVAGYGDGQRWPVGEQSPRPVTVQVLDAAGMPRRRASVRFDVVGPGEAVIPNPVTTDGKGFARTWVMAGDEGGPIRVFASTPGAPSRVSFSLFARRLSVDAGATSFDVTIENETGAVPGNVGYVIMMAFPGSPMARYPQLSGPLCLDPASSLTTVIEDGTGVFNYVSFSGQGGVGSPGLTRTYPLVPGVLNGWNMTFQAVGLDPQYGWFRTNCPQVQF